MGDPAAETAQRLRTPRQTTRRLREVPARSRTARARTLLLLAAMDTRPDPDLVLRNAVAAAVMAPSAYNTQPWRFRITGTRLDLFADPQRHLDVIDPERRQLIQSCGCAMLNARVAVRAMGFEDEVTTMFVDNDLPDHLATLHLRALRVPTDLDRTLMHAIGQRATNRRSFVPRPVGQTETDALAAVAEAHGATMIRLDPAQKSVLAQLVEEADQIELADPAFRDQLAHWLAPAGSPRRDGVPFVEKEYGSERPFALGRAMRSPALGEVFGLLEEALVQASPVVVMLGTRDDDPASWFACGQALEAVLLHATALGLSAAFLNQVLELPASRAKLAALAPRIGLPQMVMRLGIPSEPIERRAPRRSIDEVIG